MFMASIFFCWFTAAGVQCAVATDDYSPHATRFACTQRLAEMQEVIKTQLPFADVKRVLCTRFTKEQLT